jgi:hypothetical protein
MFGSAILDTAIGLIFVYLVVSLIVSAANELLAALFRWRANNLCLGIRELLQDPTITGLATRFYEHPLIESLSAKGKKPSYIPSRTFALTLLDIVSPTTSGSNRTLEDLKAGIEKLPDSLQVTFRVLLDEAGHDIEQFKIQLEIWFNATMERVSGWYKRKTQAIQLALALSIVVLGNVDSVRITRSLSGVNSPLRDSIKEAAHSFIEKNLQQENAQTQLSAATEAIGSLAMPIGWVNGGFGPTTILGWLITALAASLGAPFWFDLLNRFVNVRASGKAPEEEPKSPKEVPLPKQPGGTGEKK